MVATMNNTGAPPVVTGSQAGLWQAVAAGMSNPQASQAVQAQLAIMAKKAANRRYISETIPKLAPALTNGLATQAFANSTPFTFNLPQPNNAFAIGVVIRTTLNYTLAAGTGATYGLTASGSLAIYDTIEVRYNKSQIKFRPLWLRQLSLAGALFTPSQPSVGSTDGGGQNDSAYLGAYLSPAMPVATGAQTYQQDIFIPFNLLRPLEDRGLLPSMPGETGVQVICTTAASLFGPDPVFNAIYATGGTGNAISAVSGTIKVLMMFRDGEIYSTTQALPYDMSVLDGTIQVQQDNALSTLVTGTAQKNLGALTILGKHYYVGTLLVDGNQSNGYSVNTNINYMASCKDGVGANVFWAVGQATNLDVQDYFWQARIRHRNHDLDAGAIFWIEAPLYGQNSFSSCGGDNDGNQYLDNTTNGWPAWHYALGINTQNGLGTVTPRIEPLTVYVNPQGLPPV